MAVIQQVSPMKLSLLLGIQEWMRAHSGRTRAHPATNSGFTKPRVTQVPQEL